MQARKKNIQIYRGDDQMLRFKYQWAAAVISIVDLYIRDEPDGTLYLRLRSDVETTQFDKTNDYYVEIEIADTDTAALGEVVYRYDVRVTLTSGKVYTIQYGEVKIIGDISTDVVGDSVPDYQHWLDSDEHDAVDGANSPSSGNVFATMDDLASAIEIVNDTTPELGGDLDATDKDIHNIKQVDFEDTYPNGDSGASATINWNNGNFQSIRLTAAEVDLSYTDPSGPCSLTLYLLGDGTARVADADHDSDAEWLDNGEPGAWGDTNNEIVGVLLYKFDTILTPKYIVSGIART